MPKVNRRSFLHMVGAAGCVPALPALPAQAAGGALAGTGIVTPSKMLWRSLHARAGNHANFAAVAGRIGVPAHAARGIGARVAGHQALAAHSVLRSARASGATAASASVRDLPKTRRRAWEDLCKWLTEDPASTGASSAASGPKISPDGGASNSGPDQPPKA